MTLSCRSPEHERRVGGTSAGIARGAGEAPRRRKVGDQLQVWVVMDVTEWTRDVIGVFASRDAAIEAMDRTTSWGFSIEEWTLEGV